MTGWDLPRLALAALLLTHVWRLQDLVDGSTPFRPLLLATAAALGFSLLHPTTGRRIVAGLRHPVTLCVLGLFALGALSVPGSLYPGLSLNVLLKHQFVAVLIYLLLIGGVRNERDVSRFAAIHVAGAFAYTVTILLRYDIGPGGRLGSLIYYDANDLGMLLDAVLPLAVHFAWRARSAVLRVAATVATVVFLLGIVRSGSRGAFLGLLAVVFYVFVRGAHIPLRWRLAGLSTITAVIVLLGSSRYWDMMRTLLEPTADYNWVGGAPGGRMEVWKRGLGYMLDNPVFGVGLGAFPVAEGTISPLAARQAYGLTMKWSAAHSSYIQVAGELGIPGIIVFLLLLWSGYRTVVPERGRPPPLGHPIAAALLGYAVAGAFLSQAYAPLLYSLLALAVASAQIPVRHDGLPAVPRRG
jgi:O-antigen ligase